MALNEAPYGTPEATPSGTVINRINILKIVSTFSKNHIQNLNMDVSTYATKRRMRRESKSSTKTRKRILKKLINLAKELAAKASSLESKLFFWGGGSLEGLGWDINPRYQN